MKRIPLHLVVGMGLLIGALQASTVSAEVLAIISGTNGTFDVTVDKPSDPKKLERIHITYRPDSTKVNCSPIYLTQTCSDRDQNNNIIQPKRYKSDTWAHLQDDLAWGGTYLDHTVCEKDPYYNGEDDPQDVTSAGSSDGATAAGTTMSDAPNMWDESFPDGVNKITSTFEVCAICKADGRILDCVTWTWTRVKYEVGLGSITAPTASHKPTPDFEVALAKYKINHQNGTVCPEEVAEASGGGSDVGTGPSKKSPTDPPVEGQASTVQWDIVNLGPQTVFGVTWTVLLDGGFWATGVVDSIGWFDSATVEFGIPGLPVGPHTLTMIADSDYLIAEYDETNNVGVDEFEVGEVVGVTPATPGVGFGITAVQPNPARRRVAATVSLTDAGRATLELMDISGRRVREIAVTGPGSHTVHIDLGRDAIPGLYVLRLRQGNWEAVRKLSIVR